MKIISLLLLFVPVAVAWNIWNPASIWGSSAKLARKPLPQP